MTLLVVMVIGAALGLLVRYVLPYRETYGALLTAGVSCAVTGIVWGALLLTLEITPDQPAIWLISLAAGFVAAAIIPFAVGKSRPKRDREQLESLLATRS